MPTYLSKCPKCGEEQEYFCKISEREIATPHCSTCKDEAGQPLKAEPAFIGNPDGGFVLKGNGWFKKGGY